MFYFRLIFHIVLSRIDYVHVVKETTRWMRGRQCSGLFAESGCYCVELRCNDVWEWGHWGLEEWNWKWSTVWHLRLTTRKMIDRLMARTCIWKWREWWLLVGWKLIKGAWCYRRMLCMNSSSRSHGARGILGRSAGLLLIVIARLRATSLVLC